MLNRMFHRMILRVFHRIVHGMVRGLPAIRQGPAECPTVHGHVSRHMSMNRCRLGQMCLAKTVKSILCSFNGLCSSRVRQENRGSSSGQARNMEMPSNAVKSLIQCSIQRFFKYFTKCSMEYCIGCLMQCHLQCSIECCIECSVKCCLGQPCR